LHGPALLAKPAEAEKPKEEPEATAAKPADPVPQAKPNGAPASAAPPEPPPADDLRHFLDRITSGLYVGAAQEFVRCFRSQVDRVARNEREKSELRELAADLQGPPGRRSAPPPHR